MLKIILTLKLILDSFKNLTYIYILIFVNLIQIYILQIINNLQKLIIIVIKTS